MQYRMMGSSGLKVSALGYGCWEMGGTYGSFDEREVIDAIQRALDLGVTLYDTALVYGFDPVRVPFETDPSAGAGRSERLLAKALGVRRKDAIVVTKGGLPTRQAQVSERDRRDSRRASLLRDIEDSLRNLETDYIDLYLIHWPDVATPFEDAMATLNDIVAAGKARYIGVSNYSADMLRTSRPIAPLCANQVGYNLFDRRWERAMFPTAQELGIGIMAYGPLAHGLLTGAFTPATRFDESDWRHRGVLFGQALFQGDNFAQNLAVVDRLKGVAARKSVSLPQLALAWVLSHPAVSVALIGVRRISELEDNVQALDIELTAADRAEIDAIMRDAAGQVDEIPS
ncbi:MAG: aldo/keto reductase [Chloroflexi bacterium]|nr:aldo/keto reductase [Chloroflexota bacterium]